MLRWIAVASFFVAGCSPPCEDTPLSSLSTAPRFVVEVDRNALATPDAGPVASLLAEGGLLDGGLPESSAPTTVYAALALYASDGTLLHDDWVDTTTRWPGARDTFDAHDLVPWIQPSGRLMLFLRDTASLVAFTYASGDVAYAPYVPGLDTVHVTGVLELSGDRALVAVSGGSLWLIGVNDASMQGQIDLGTQVGAARAGRMVPLPNDTSGRVVVGLGGVVGSSGGVAVVDVTNATARLVTVPALHECLEVSALADGSIAVLCAGTGDAMTDAGLALLEADASAQVLTTTATQTSASISATYPPTEGLVGMAEGWAAVISRGDASGQRDALLAVHLADGTTRVLEEEYWDVNWGAALGEGAFAPEIGDQGELWWPSVRNGMLRYRIQGSGADATFASQPAVALPPCLARMPVRRVRAAAP